MNNQEIAKIFSEISEYLGMTGDFFRPRAYARAAQSIGNLEKDVQKIYKEDGLKGLMDIPGVGKSIAESIEEYLGTGEVAYLNQLKKKVPIDISTLTQVEGLGAKRIKTLYNELKVENLDDLERVAKEGKIRNLEGFGEKSEKNILRGIEFLHQSGGRFVRGFVASYTEELRKRLEGFPGVLEAQIAGSARRKKETVGDLDILVSVRDGKMYLERAQAIMEFFVSMPEVLHIYGQGDTKSSVRLKNGMNADLRVIKKESFGAGLLYFTGSKEHNVALRTIAIKKGMKLNEYGLYKKGKKKDDWDFIVGETEKEIYSALGLDYISPELRENTGEITASELIAGKSFLPNLIKQGDLKGDLQIQTNWSDGENTIEEYARAAIKKGLSYILITDHSKRLTIAHGLDEKRLKQQWKEIDKVNEKLAKEGHKFAILKGIECDILKDGAMDLSDKILAELDIVGGSVHSYFDSPADLQTRRMIRAMENENVDMIFHPTARIINQRRAINLDFEEVIKTAKKTRTALEINSYPDRLDIKDDLVKICVEEGIKLTINSDAHSITHLNYLEFGVDQARRGWAEKKNVFNTLPVDKCLKQLRK